MFLLLLLLAASPGATSQSATLIVEVRTAAGPAAGADVTVNGRTQTTGGTGSVTIPVPAGRVRIDAVKEGFTTATAVVDVRPGQRQPVILEIRPVPGVEEEVTVVATTRTGKRVEDLPMRVKRKPRGCRGCRFPAGFARKRAAARRSTSAGPTDPRPTP